MKRRSKKLENYDNVNFSNETKLKEKVMEYLDTLKPQLAYRKMAHRFIPGVSDIVGCYKGKFFAIELKVGYNKPTQHQINYLDEHMIAGGKTAVCKTLGQVKEFIKLIKEE